MPAACETVPYTGRSQLQLDLAEQEDEMGVQAFKQIVGKAKLVQRRARRTRWSSEWASASPAVTGLPDAQWEYRLIQDDKQVNAFALPGGKVAVYTGILPVTKDETGSPPCSATRSATCCARHGGERMSQQMGAQMPSA